MVLPLDVERRLLALEKELNDAQRDLMSAEDAYNNAKRDYDLGMAKARIALKSSGEKMTVQEFDDRSLVICEDLYTELLAAEVWQRGAKANINRIHALIDIARSLGASVRSAMEL